MPFFWYPILRVIGTLDLFVIMSAWRWCSLSETTYRYLIDRFTGCPPAIRNGLSSLILLKLFFKNCSPTVICICVLTLGPQLDWMLYNWFGSGFFFFSFWCVSKYDSRLKTDPDPALFFCDVLVASVFNFYLHLYSILDVETLLFRQFETFNDWFIKNSYPLGPKTIDFSPCIRRNYCLVFLLPWCASIHPLMHPFCLDFCPPFAFLSYF